MASARDLAQEVLAGPVQLSLSVLRLWRHFCDRELLHWEGQEEKLRLC